MGTVSRRVLFVFGALSLVAYIGAGCGPGTTNGDDDENGDTGTDAQQFGDPVELDDYPDRTAESFCHGLYNCCNDRETEAVAQDYAAEFFAGGELFVESEQECRTAIEDYLRDEVLPELRDAKNEGRITYDSTGMSLCAPKPENFSCANFPRTEAFVCDAGVQPKAGLGDDCKNTFECAVGVCTGTNPFDDTGTCTKPSGAGNSCGDAGCQEGLYCDDDDDICREQKTLGANCNEPAQCHSLVCAEKDSGGEVCAPKKSSGSSCAGDYQCKSGECGTDDTCLAAPVCDGR